MRSATGHHSAMSIGRPLVSIRCEARHRPPTTGRRGRGFSLRGRGAPAAASDLGPPFGAVTRPPPFFLPFLPLRPFGFAFFVPIAGELLHHLRICRNWLMQLTHLAGLQRRCRRRSAGGGTRRSVGVDPLGRGHRVDDRLDPADLRGRRSRRRAPPWARPGIMPMRLLSGPIFLICCICSRKSSRVNVPSRSRAAASSASSSLEGLLGLLDERDHVAHAEDAAGQAVGVERLEVVELLAGGGEGDRLADDLLDRQRRTTAGVAVELGQDHAVERERLVEGLGRR